MVMGGRLGRLVCRLVVWLVGLTFASLGCLFSATLIKNAHSVAHVAYKDTGTHTHTHARMYVKLCTVCMCVCVCFITHPDNK